MCVKDPFYDLFICECFPLSEYDLSVCSSFPVQKKHSQFEFNLKLHSGHVNVGGVPGHPHSAHHSKPPDLLEMLTDLNANLEHGCKVLQVCFWSYVVLLFCD